MRTSLEGISEKPIKAEVDVPVSVSLFPLDPSFKATGKIRGRIFARLKLEDMAGFAQLADHILKGDLLVDLGLEGDPERPDITGRVKLSDARYEYLVSGTIIQDIQLDADVSGRRFLLKSLNATDGGAGRISAEGWLDILPKEAFPFRLDLAAESGTLLRGDELTATADGRLNISGSTRSGKLSGSLTISSAELRIPDSFPPEVKDIEIVEVNLPKGRAKSERTHRHASESSMHLDILLNVPGQFFVRGRGLESEWKGRLRVLGAAANPALTGELSVIRGRYNFFGKPFALKRGTIAFDGNMPPSPRIDVTTEHSRSDMTTRITISGTPDSLKVNIESDPPMPSDEILSHLLFGRSASGITAFQALKLAQAVGSLTGGRGMFDFMDRTRRLLGMDQIDIKELGGDTSVSVGKYLRENVYVEMEKGLQTEQGKVSVEIELTPNISVETDAGADANAGVGVNWKWDY